MEKIEVVGPVGVEIIEQKTITPRLSNLDGKTVCEMWNGQYKGDYLFPVLRELIKTKHPGAKVMPYSEFPLFYAGDAPKQHKEFAKTIATLAKEKGCDALITGNGA